MANSAPVEVLLGAEAGQSQALNHSYILYAIGVSLS